MEEKGLELIEQVLKNLEEDMSSSNEDFNEPTTMEDYLIPAMYITKVICVFICISAWIVLIWKLRELKHDSVAPATQVFGGKVAKAAKMGGTTEDKDEKKDFFEDSLWIVSVDHISLCALYCVICYFFTTLYLENF